MGSPRARSGLTLVELLVALAVVALLSALAVPRFARYTARIRVHGALDRLATDTYLARALAARGGAELQIRFTSPDAAGCIPGYALVALEGGVPGPPLRTVSFAEAARGVCVTSNRLTPLIFTPRGLLSASPRTVTARGAGGEERLTISIVGRVYRSY